MIAYGHGGSLETVRVGHPDGLSDTGVFFKSNNRSSRSQKAFWQFESQTIALLLRIFGVSQNSIFGFYSADSAAGRELQGRAVS